MKYLEEETEVGLHSEVVTEVLHHSEEIGVAVPEVRHLEEVIEKGREEAHLEEDLQVEEVHHPGLPKEILVASQEKGLPEVGLLEGEEVDLEVAPEVDEDDSSIN